MKKKKQDIDRALEARAKIQKIHTKAVRKRRVITKKKKEKEKKGN